MVSDTAPIPRRAVASWVVYDLANTIFSMGVISLYFPFFVGDAVGSVRADSVYSRITAVSMGLIFIISPLLGAMTDRARRRMPFLVWSTIACCLATALLGRGPFVLTAVLFIIANATYQAGLQFYDALLPEVTTATNRGRVGGIGVGVGYFGSYLAVGIGALFGTADKPFLFLVIAVGFLLFALPCFMFVKERGNPNPRPIFGLTMIRESTAQTLRTLREGHRYPGLLRFLVGRVFYTDAINTVIAFMSIYTKNVAAAGGLTKTQGEQQANLVLAAAITSAVIGGFAWGSITDAIGPKRTLTLVLWTWVGIFGLASLVGALALPLVWLYVVACFAGMALGGVWAADRPYMLRLTPPDRVGEFYGLYGMVGRFSAVSGPVIWGATTYVFVERGGWPILQGEAIAIATLLVMVVLSLWILRTVTDAPRDWDVLGTKSGSR
jgi:UMF1 family MFS transporter